MIAVIVQVDGCTGQDDNSKVYDLIEIITTQNWNYLDSVYFVVTSLLKVKQSFSINPANHHQIGLGDYVPGSGERDGEMHHAKLYINYSYLLCKWKLIYCKKKNKEKNPGTTDFSPTDPTDLTFQRIDLLSFELQWAWALLP